MNRMRRFLLFLSGGLLLILTGCSLPRLIVLNDPLDARQHNDLGVSYQARGEYDLALREFARAADLDDAWAQPLINRGNALALQEDWQGAARSYRQALQRDADNAEAMNNLAWVLLNSGDAEGALPLSEKAVARDPGNPAFLDTLVEIQLRRGDEGAAALLIERALELDPAPVLRRSLEEKRDRL
jgi:tetratricopeptide (TPR) repeat protein